MIKRIPSSKLLSMLILENMTQKAHPKRPSAITIGSFDGVHLGHQLILQKMRELVGPNGNVGVVTFSNHPSHVLPGRDPIKLIFSKSLKMKYLETFNVDITYCQAFTKEIASLKYNDFLGQLMQSCPFDFLVLGHGATLGSKRGGSEEKVKALSKTMGFETHYLDKVKEDREIISSGMIRKFISEGKIKEATLIMGHKHWMEANVTEDKIKIDPKICVPKDGIFDVFVHQENAVKPSQLIFRSGNIKINTALFNGSIFIEF